MDQCVLIRLTVIQSLLQRVQNKVRSHGTADPPAHNPAGIHVDHKGHVLPALPGRDVREVRYPQLVGAISLELAIDPVQRTWRRCIRYRGTNDLASARKVGKGKERSVNARFESMTGHYLFEAEFCNRAAGWEKGRVEKNVQDRRRHIWREAAEKRWASLAELNSWLIQACQDSWSELTHPDWPELTVADVLQDERTRLMRLPKPFDGYVEQPARVTATSLIHFQRNRYSVPCEWVNSVVSLRAYPELLRVVSIHGEMVDLVRSFERDQTFYDWQHYITLIERKPGALRNGAPFKTMPEPLQELQRQLLKNPGGDRVIG